MALKLHADTLLSLSGLAAIGSLTPAIAVLGELGSVLAPSFGLRATLFSIFAAPSFFMRWPASVISARSGWRYAQSLRQWASLIFRRLSMNAEWLTQNGGRVS